MVLGEKLQQPSSNRTGLEGWDDDIGDKLLTINHNDYIIHQHMYVLHTLLQ